MRKHKKISELIILMRNWATLIIHEINWRYASNFPSLEFYKTWLFFQIMSVALNSNLPSTMRTDDYFFHNVIVISHVGKVRQIKLTHYRCLVIPMQSWWKPLPALNFKLNGKIGWLILGNFSLLLEYKLFSICHYFHEVSMSIY